AGESRHLEHLGFGTAETGHDGWTGRSGAEHDRGTDWTRAPGGGGNACPPFTAGTGRQCAARHRGGIRVGADGSSRTGVADRLHESREPAPGARGGPPKGDCCPTGLRRLQFREVLVTAQITLSVVLLVGTVLVVRSLQRALTIDIGFNPRHAVAVSFDLGLEGFDSTRGSQFQQRLLEKISARPGIETAAWANSLPLGLDQSTTEIYAEGKPIPKPSDVPSANYYMVSPGYFRT